GTGRRRWRARRSPVLRLRVGRLDLGRVAARDHDEDGVDHHDDGESEGDTEGPAHGVLQVGGGQPSLPRRGARKVASRRTWERSLRPSTTRSVEASSAPAGARTTSGTVRPSRGGISSGGTTTSPPGSP